jgi:hypothetical protein
MGDLVSMQLITMEDSMPFMRVIKVGLGNCLSNPPGFELLVDFCVSVLQLRENVWKKDAVMFRDAELEDVLCSLNVLFLY